MLLSTLKHSQTGPSLKYEIDLAQYSTLIFTTILQIIESGSFCYLIPLTVIITDLILKHGKL